MSEQLAIDHPLIAVRDLDAALALYRSLGFYIAPPGQHPWGTATALALFSQQILELVSIADEQRLDTYPAGSFVFGRHIQHYLERGEGVALCALFTDDAERTAAALTMRGIACTGTINFGRDVIRADGQPDRTRTTLKIFYRDSMPRLSVFACQQHRRDLLEFPERMQHPNSAHGIDAATILAHAEEHRAVIHWLETLHNTQAQQTPLGMQIRSANGVWRVLSPADFTRQFGAPIAADFLADGPRIAALDVRVRDLKKAVHSLDSNIDYTMQEGALCINNLHKLGGIALRFVQKP